MILGFALYGLYVTITDTIKFCKLKQMDKQYFKKLKYDMLYNMPYLYDEDKYGLKVEDVLDAKDCKRLNELLTYADNYAKTKTMNDKYNGE